MLLKRFQVLLSLILLINTNPYELLLFGVRLVLLSPKQRENTIVLYQQFGGSQRSEPTWCLFLFA